MQTTISRTVEACAAASDLQLGVRWVFPDRAGRFSALTKTPVRVGRDPENDVVLDSTQVSRFHAEIVRDGDRLVVKDLNSKNATLINGHGAHGHTLALGDVLRFGDWIGVFAEGRVSEPGPAFDVLSTGLVVGPVLRRRLAMLYQVVTTDLPVLLVGESGTGKELVAKSIHALSGRPGPYCGVNCASLPESLAEAELFGYRKGAFTGAERAHPGHFRAADRGTLLLDEIPELTPALQAKLLRVLEEKAVQPLSEPAPIAVDVRVVAAAQTHLEPLVAEKRFRLDLFARLSGVVVTLAPLRDRREEIVNLFRHFLGEAMGAKAPAFSAGVAQLLCLHSWPHNMRDMTFLIKRIAAVHSQKTMLRSADVLPLLVPAPAVESAAKTSKTQPTQADLIAAIQACEGNLARAASRLGITRPFAYRMLKGVNLDLVRKK